MNAAGLQALDIARLFGTGQNLAIFPMKGLYCMSKTPLHHKYGSIVYPIPLKGAYTLGVHSTMTPSGHMKIGPTTSPAFSLENYQGLENIKLSYIAQILKSYLLILSSSQRGLIWEYLTRDLPKHQIKVLVKDICRIHHMDINDFESQFYSKPGIRCQLIDMEKQFLINDFLLKKDDNAIHALNIASPGWTSAFPFSNKIVAELMGLDEEDMEEII